MAEALEAVTLSAPSVPLISNVTAAPVTDTQEIKSLLVRQVTGVVRWRESVAYMVDHGASTLFEIGAGRVLTGIARAHSRRRPMRAPWAARKTSRPSASG